MDIESFMKLVEENNGFEMVIGFRDDIDHLIGGTGNKYWYYIDNDGKSSSYYIGTYEDGKWSDKFYKTKHDKIQSSESVESGTTINKIIERAYYYQDKIGNKKPQRVEKEEDTYLHYVYGFGDKAWEVSEKYGVTTFFSNINNEEEGYHLRDILTGKDVEKPNES